MRQGNRGLIEHETATIEHRGHHGRATVLVLVAGALLAACGQHPANGSASGTTLGHRVPTTTLASAHPSRTKSGHGGHAPRQGSGHGDQGSTVDIRKLIPPIVNGGKASIPSTTAASTTTSPPSGSSTTTGVGSVPTTTRTGGGGGSTSTTTAPSSTIMPTTTVPTTTSAPTTSPGTSSTTLPPSTTTPGRAGVAGPLAAVSFASPSIGWAVGQGAAGGGLILATTNGGSSWSPQAFPAALTGVRSVSTTTAWAWGQGMLLRTTNGTSWTPVPLPSTTPIQEVRATSAQQAWVIVGAAGSPGSLEYTANAGGSWTLLTPPLASVQQVCVAPGSGSMMWAASGEQVAASTNGGVTWGAPVAASTALGGVPQALHLACSGSDLWLEASGGAAGSNAGWAVFASTDAGKTWRPAVEDAYVFSPTPPVLAAPGAQPGPVSLAGTGSVAVIGESPQQVTPPSVRGGVLGSAAGIDGGLPLAGATAAGATAPVGVSFVNSTTGWAVGQTAAGQGEIVRTTNGGATWGVQFTGS